MNQLLMLLLQSFSLPLRRQKCFFVLFSFKDFLPEIPPEILGNPGKTRCFVEPGEYFCTAPEFYISGAVLFGTFTK
jgi:hypothetical protein